MNRLEKILSQGSETRVDTQKTRRVFLGVNPPKNPAKTHPKFNPVSFHVLLITKDFKIYFSLILYTVAFCQLLIKDMMDGHSDAQNQCSIFRNFSNYGRIFTISQIFSIKEWPDLEIWVWGRSRSFKMARFDRPCTTFYWSAIVTIALSCTVFELFDVE